jgi:hypothetical protein
VVPLYKQNAKHSVELDIIPERDGQILYGYLQDSFRDFGFPKKHHRLSVKLNSTEKTFAMGNDGNARRVQVLYVAEVTLRNEERKVVFQKNISVTRSHNISSAQGEAVFSLYGRNSNVSLKELADKIAEHIRIFLLHEN